MATIYSAVRAMLLDGSSLATAGIADANVTHGYRLQDTPIPALTFEATRNEPIAISAGPLYQADFELRIIASTTSAALALVPTVRSLCISGTFDSTVFHSVIWKGATIDSSTVAEGDESDPVEIACLIEITYKE